MLDDDNAKEIEAALREDDDYDIEDGLTPEEREAVRAEALAEEEFIADREDTVNPLIFDKATKQAEDLEHEDLINLEARYGRAFSGVIGSGNLAVEMAEVPISNENELRKENVNEDNNPISNPVDVDAAPTGDVVDSTSDAPVTDPGLGGDAAAPDMNAAPAGEEAPSEMSMAMDAEMAATSTDPVPAPSADIPSATDTPTPIPGGMPTTPTDATANPAGAPAAAPKKKKTGLIIGIVVLLVILVGGGIAGLIFYQSHEKPEKQVSDAVINILTAPQIGTASKAASLSSGELAGVKMNISTSIPKSDKEKIDISLTAEVALKGTEALYMKIGGVKDVMNNVMKELGGEEESGAEQIKGIVDSVVGEIDNKWIGVSVSDLEKSAKSSCLSESIKKLEAEDYRKKVKDIYDKNPFVKYKEGSEVESRDGLNYYTVELDEEKQKAFGEELEKTDEYKAFDACIEEVVGGAMGSLVSSASELKDSVSLTTVTLEDEEDEKIEVESIVDETEEDWGYDEDDWSTNSYDESDWEVSGSSSLNLFDSVKSDDMTVVVKLGISSWAHELKAAEVTGTDKDNNTTKLSLKLETYKDGDVSSAVTVEELSEKITKALKDELTKMAKTQVAETCKEYEDSLEYLGYSSLEDCEEKMLEEYEKQLGGIDSSSLLGGMGMGLLTT